jgi:hypothetical protein
MKGSFKTALIAALVSAFVAAGAAVATTKTFVLGTRGSGYGGIGATVSAFKAGNSTGRDCGGSIGLGCYHITKTRQGRVVSYSVRAYQKRNNRQRLWLAEGINLPPDARKVRDGATCQVFQSRTLRRLVGMRYAVATTVTGTTSAEMSAKSSPRC